jgi:hypothetical protein
VIFQMGKKIAIKCPNFVDQACGFN